MVKQPACSPALSKFDMVLTPLFPLPEAAPTQTGLLVFDYNATPPHIALLAHGNYFALTYHGSEFRPDLEVLWKKRLVHVPRLLFIALNTPLVTDRVREVFQAYPPLNTGDSCLNPIIQLFQEYYGQKVQAPFLKGCIEWLDSQHAIQSFHVHLDAGKTHIQLPDYGREHIDNRIASLLSARKP